MYFLKCHKVYKLDKYIDMLTLSLEDPYYYYPIYILHNSEKKYATTLFFLSRFFASSPLVYVYTPVYMQSGIIQ